MSFSSEGRLQDVQDPVVAAAVVAFVRDGVEVTRCPLVVRSPVDLDAVDRLARLQLLARRLGGVAVLRSATPRFVGLLRLVGLLGEVGGQPERREQLGIEEVVLPGDLAVDDVEDLQGERRMAAGGVDPVGAERRGAVCPRRQEA